jgi:hypothetical protein
MIVTDSLARLGKPCGEFLLQCARGTGNFVMAILVRTLLRESGGKTAALHIGDYP